jgi:uncharacterized protein
MTSESKQDYVNYRFQRAQESFEEATLLINNNRWNATINRLYYSCFYAAIALLLKYDVQAKTHDGVRIQFGLQFIKTGLMDKRFGKLYSQLFDFRQKGDYGDMFNFDIETVEPLMNLVAEFIQEIKNHLDAN